MFMRFVNRTDSMKVVEGLGIHCKELNCLDQLKKGNNGRERLGGQQSARNGQLESMSR